MQPPAVRLAYNVLTFLCLSGAGHAMAHSSQHMVVEFGELGERLGLTVSLQEDEYGMTRSVRILKTIRKNVKVDDVILESNGCSISNMSVDQVKRSLVDVRPIKFVIARRPT